MTVSLVKHATTSEALQVIWKELWKAFSKDVFSMSFGSCWGIVGMGLNRKWHFARNATGEMLNEGSQNINT